MQSGPPFLVWAAKTWNLVHLGGFLDSELKARLVSSCLRW